MKIDVIRAWKDERYRASLTEEQRASLPANPAGLVDLSEAELAAVTGGVVNADTPFTAGCSLYGWCG